jgi:hypothetical protein
MSERDFRPVRAVVGQLRVAHLKGFVGFWAIVGGGWAVAATVIILIGHADLSLWHTWGTTPSKYFLMAMGIHAAAVYVPLYIGHGVTRRHFALGAATFFGATSVVFAGAILAGYLIELIMYGASGQFGGVNGSNPVDSVGGAFTVFARWVLIYAAFVCTGWLIGASFYRYGVWIGILLIPVGAVPGFVTDFAVGTGTYQSGDRLRDVVDLGAADLPVGFAIGAILLVIGLVGAFMLVRDVPIRKVTA